MWLRELTSRLLREVDGVLFTAQQNSKPAARGAVEAAAHFVEHPAHIGKEQGKELCAGLLFLDRRAGRRDLDAVAAGIAAFRRGATHRGAELLGADHGDEEQGRHGRERWTSCCSPWSRGEALLLFVRARAWEKESRGAARGRRAPWLGRRASSLSRASAPGELLPALAAR
uniref:Uncharacterized protein n=1 Tax=Zea mays TaxID=4577 RepID=A0A804Q7Y8_MAIZE